MGNFDFLSSTDPQTGENQFNPNLIMFMADLAQALGQGKGAGESLGGAASAFTRNRANQQAAAPMFNTLQPTPKGMEGPDEITTKQTADGTVTTVKTPSQANLSTYGTSVPAEAQPGRAATDAPMSPFWQALLSNRRK